MKSLKKRGIIITTTLVGSVVASSLGSFLVSAESFQSEQDVQFTFEPTLTVTVSSNEISIDSLVPGSYSDSNIVTVTTSSNAISGYSLSSTVGNNTHNYNTLKHASSNDTFANLTSNKASLSAFSDNTWGYSYSTDSGSTWISGDVGSTATGYNGLPLCNQSDVTECSGAQLVDTNTNGSTAIQFKIGAKASSSQPAGAYSNVINFVGVAKPNPVPPVSFDDAFAAAGKTKQDGYYKMQDGTASICEAVTEGQVGQLIDPRDNEVYYVGKLKDGNCWMLDNLRLGDTSTIDLTPADTNIASNYTLPVSGTTNFFVSTGYTTAALNADYKNTTTTSYGAGSGKIGNYYNYCAASAGTYCYPVDEGTGNAEHDICPAGWRMPTGEIDGEYHALCSIDDPNCQKYYYSEIPATSTSSLQYNLSTPLSGRFILSSAGDQGSYGSFWSSTMSSGRSMRLLYVSPGDVHPTNVDYRYAGVSVRCLLGS